VRPDISDLPGNRAEIEAAMRADYARVFRLWTAAEFARTYAEQVELLQRVDQIAEGWEGPMDEWSRHWRYLDDAWVWMADQPVQARQYLAGITDRGGLDPDPATAATKLASLQQAFTLDTEYRAATATPRTIDERTLETLPYTAIYAAKGRFIIHDTFTSWWKAREWIRDHTYTHPALPASIVITGRDLRTGNQHILMTAEHADPAALRAELTRLGRLLGEGRAVDGKPWLDELCADILADEYRKNVAAQLNPWEVRHRFEHQLRADDLRDQCLDFTGRAGITAGADHLAAVDSSVRRANLYAVDPAATSWLDDTVAHVEHLSGQLQHLGVDTQHSVPGDPAVTIVAGWSIVHGDTPWYAEVRVAHEHGGWICTPEGPSGRYRSCGDLVTALQRYRTASADPAGSQPIPSEVATALWGFEGQLTELRDDIATTQRIRDHIRTCQPYRLTCSQTAQSPPASPVQTDSPAVKPVPAAPNPSKTTEQNRERGRQRRDRAARQPRLRTQPRRRKP